MSDMLSWTLLVEFYVHLLFLDLSECIILRQSLWKRLKKHENNIFCYLYCHNMGNPQNIINAPVLIAVVFIL